MSGYIDWSDYDVVAKIHERYIRRLVQLRMKIRDVEKTGDEKAISKAKEAFFKHKRQEDAIKKKAKDSNYFSD